MSELLSASGLARTYRGGPVPVPVIRGLDLDLGEGESLAVVGESGVGKSTLLHLLGAIDRPDEGKILFRGRPLPLEPTERARWRNREVGFVFQFHHLLPEFTAAENVAMPALIAGRPRARVLALARELLAELGLGPREGHRPDQLSGGEQQRVALARAVAAEPALVIADEPTGNLDTRTGDEVFALLRSLQQARRFTLVMATHSERLAGGCDRILHLAEGRLQSLRRADLGWSETP
jgi:lipoprotein-releasing system ATP-binding protein